MKFFLNSYLLISLIMWETYGLDNGDISTADFRHIVIIPDVHGDSDALLKSLWGSLKRLEPSYNIAFEVFNDVFYNRIIKGKQSHAPLSTRRDVVVVQLGDLVDRGPDSAYCISIMGAVSELIGWRVVRLYGNHELLSMLADGSEYIHSREAIGFGGVASRDASFQQGGFHYNELTKNFVGFAKISSSYPSLLPGLLHKRNPNTLFVHGGVDLEWLSRQLGADELTISALNERFAELASEGREGQDQLSGRGSILWTRVMAETPEEEICSTIVDEVLTGFGVARIIVGHTPQDNMLVNTRCDGRIVLADVRMSRWMNDSREANPVAIIMSMNRDGSSLDSMVAHYVDPESWQCHRQQVLVAPPSPSGFHMENLQFRRGQKRSSV